MKPNFLGLVAVTLLSALSGIGLAEPANGSNVAANTAVLQEEGRAFRKEVFDTFFALGKLKVEHIKNLTDLCRKHRFVGLTLREADIKLTAAGQKGGMVSGHNLQLPADSEDKDDMIGGFIIYSSLISGAQFNIRFRPEPSGEGKERRIKEIMSCGVISHFFN